MILTRRILKNFSSSIILDYRDLKAGKNLTAQIQAAYGPKGYGILFVENIPDYVQMRVNTLPLFTKLANLPSDVLKKYIRPQIFYSLGWSCGVEQFQGKYDTSKGSYYVNCSRDKLDHLTPQEMKLYSQNQKKVLFAQNKWVDQLPELQRNVKALSKTMIHAGSLLAKQIDNYAQSQIPKYPQNHLYRIITEGQNHVGRILHYYPIQNKGTLQDDWCGWHNDHGSLTALTSAMYCDQQGKEVKFPIKTGGLHAKNRFAQMARIKIPPHALAFQLGQSTEIHTGGHLQATPHCVVTSQEIIGKKIGRNTFALFMQPNHLQKMSVPQGESVQNVAGKEAYKIPKLKDRWINGQYFKDFHHKTIEYYT